MTAGGDPLSKSTHGLPRESVASSAERHKAAEDRGIDRSSPSTRADRRRAILDSGFDGSVNHRDAILMGIDRVEYFLGGDVLSAAEAWYSSYDNACG